MARARWQLFDVAHAPIVAEIEKEGDRGAAIVATAFLQEQLVESIKACLVNDPQIVKKVFGDQTALSSLAAQIDIGLLLGIYGKRDHRELSTIRTIRNKFAHSVRPVTFKSEGVSALCNNLPAPRNKRPPRITDERDERLFETDNAAWMSMWLDWIRSGKDTPRNRFLIAVRMHYFRFCLWRMVKESTGEKPLLSLPDRSPPRLSH